MVGVLFSTAALLFGCAIFVAATGLLGTAVSLRASSVGFADAVTGVVMASYFAGFVIGTYICPRVVRSVGHIRSFAVFAALVAAAVLSHALIVDPVVWALLRFLSGACVVGLYMVVESWLNEKSPNASRGRVFAVYQIVSLTSLGVGQWLLLIDPATFATPFLICGALFALGLVPVALTKVPEPKPIPRVKMQIGKLWQTSPLGVLGTFTSALANGVLMALGPLFVLSSDMGVDKVALFMSVVIFGGSALQWPLGLLADRFDRRPMILAVGLSSALLALLCALTANWSQPLFFLLAFLYGGFTFSLYPLCVSHSNDHADPDDLVSTASGLLLVYGVGATIGPLVSGSLMSLFGPMAFFAFLLAAHVGLCAIAIIRMLTAPAEKAAEHQPFVMITRTSQSALTMLEDAVGNARKDEPEEDGRAA